MSHVDRSRLPQSGPGSPFSFPGAEKTRLHNGLTLWALQRGSLPLVSIVVSLPAGSWCDPPGLPGLASLTADMLDEGTGNRSAIDIQEILARLGADLDIEAAHDSVTISMTVLQRHLSAGLGLLADVLCRPRLAEFDIERLRTLRLNRLRQLRDVPAALAEQAFADTLYADHPYAHLPLGTSEAIPRMTRSGVAEFHASSYRPDAATIIVVGPGAVDDILNAVAHTFEAWHTEGRPASAGASSIGRVTFDPARPRLVVIDRPGAAQTELRIGHVAAPRHTPDFHALLVLNAALGGQFVSRINLNLRERKGYTYGARTAFEFRKHPGPFSLATSVQTDATADAIAESLGEIRAIRGDRPVTTEELAMAQQTLTLGYPRNFESTGQVARALSQLVVHDLPDDTFAVYAPRVLAQDMASVTAAARMHLNPDHLAVVAVGDRERIESGLRTLGLGNPHIVDPVL
jgi:zinc protease